MEQHENRRYAELLDQGRAELAAESRERQRVLEQVQRESATLVGALVDLAERGDHVSTVLSTGATVPGTVGAVGSDVVLVGETWLRLDAVVSVRVVGAGAATGDRVATSDLSLAHLLDRLAGDRSRVVLLVHGGEPVRGELLAVGQDVASVRLDGGDGAVAYVPTAAVAGVRVTS